MYKFSTMMVAAMLLAACSSSQAPPQPPAAAASSSGPAAAPGARAAVRSLVEQFGKQMQKVSTLAPPSAMRRQLQSVYGGLLSPQLLETWQAHPDRVVGREVSSPWPSGIDINRIDCPTAIRCHVQGQVRYVTSNEVEHGGVAARRPVRLRVEWKHDTGWRIAAVEVGKP